MRLSDLPFVAGSALRRDGEFRSLGLAHQHLDAMLTMVYERRYAEIVAESTTTSCVIARPELHEGLADRVGVIVDEDPANLFYKIHTYLAQSTTFYGASVPNEIAPTASIHPRAYVAPTDVRVGSGTVVAANATILERSLIGANVAIGPGCVIGAKGFGPRLIDGVMTNIPHAGGVQIDDHVELLANCSVARGTFGGLTRIGERTTLNALVYVGHNATIGRCCRIAASVVINGRVAIGDDVWIGPNATISNGIVVGDAAAVTLGAVVVRDVAAGARVTGYFAIDHRTFLRSHGRRKQG